MSNQAAVHSIQALKDLRVALALFSDDVMGALGAVEMEVRRTIQWLQHDRKLFWQDQLKKRREHVAAAKAELFRRQLAKRPDSSPSCIEQKELLRKAEASLQEAEMRIRMVKKWETALPQAAFEYHGSVRRINDLASGDVPRAMARLERMIDALEAYLRVQAPSGRGAENPLESIAVAILDADDSPAEKEAEPPATSDDAEVEAHSEPETSARPGEESTPD